MPSPNRQSRWGQAAVAPPRSSVSVEVVEGDALTAGDAALRLVPTERGAVERRGAWLAVSAALREHTSRGGRPTNEIASSSCESVRRSSAPPTTTVALATSTATAYDRCISAERAEPSALPHRHELDRIDFADDPPIAIDDPAGVEGDAIPQEVAATARRRDEAHVLAVGLRGGAKAERVCALADLVLRQPTDRQHDALQGALVEHVQHVRLVLAAVGAAEQADSSGHVTIHPGVVAGGDAVEPEEVGALDQAVELQMAVAFHAGVRREPIAVRVDVGSHDVTQEVVAEVEDRVVDAQLLRDAPGVIDITDRAAAAVALASPQLHRDADDVVTGLEQQRGGHGRVDAARHGDQHLHRATSAAGRSPRG